MEWQGNLISIPNANYASVSAYVSAGREYAYLRNEAKLASISHIELLWQV